MKRGMKKVLALVLGAVMCLGVLTGCSKFEADALVKGNLDLIYLNTYTAEYLESVSLTPEEADAQYEDGIAVEVDYFTTYFEINMEYCSADIEQQIVELYHKIYDCSKYEVGEVSKSGDTFLVQLTVYPIDIMEKVYNEDLEGFLAGWSDAVATGEINPDDDAAFETAWAQGVIDMVSARVDSIGYLDGTTISVQVVKDENGYFTIDSNDFARIDSLIISYPY